ncbi:MAG: hypothetical protein ACFCUT_21060 [Kiloniellaceae bacterium]
MPNVRAGAADFGLATAQGLADVGEVLGDMGDRLSMDARAAAGDKNWEAEKTEAKESQLATADAMSDIVAHWVNLREAAIQMVDSWEYDGSPPQEAARKASQVLSAFEEGRLKDLPPERRAAAKEATASIRQGHGLRTAQRAQNRNVEALNQKTGETLRLLERQAVREPQAAERYAAEGTALLASLFKVGALSEGQFAAQSESFRRSLYAAVVRGQPAVAALADLEDGAYDEALADPTLKRLLMTETAWRLQGEAAQGAVDVEGQLARARRGEVVPAALRARAQRVLEAGAMADAELLVERAQRVRSELQSLRYAPEAAVEEGLTVLASTADGLDADERLKIREEVWVQSQAMLRERHGNPAAYVMDQPAVAEAFAAAERDPALLPDAVAARLAAQAAMGLAPEVRSALTKEERGQILAGLQQLAPKDRCAALQALGRLYGDQVGQVAIDLAEAGLSPLETLLLDPGSDTVSWQKIARLVDGQQEEQRSQSPDADIIAEAAERLLQEGRQTRGSSPADGSVPPEDISRS